MYADIEYYKNTYKGTLDGIELEKALKQASEHIDTLTYNRIVEIGFDNLTEYQQEIITECACLIADWETENADVINSMLSSYSLNGANMSFSGQSANAEVVNGIAVSKSINQHLHKCGLCSRVLRGC